MKPLNREAMALRVACKLCASAKGERCKFFINGPELSVVSHPIRYIHAEEFLATTANNLWISIRGRWECHRSSSLEIRDYLRGVWRAAGHATAVEI